MPSANAEKLYDGQFMTHVSPSPAPEPLAWHGLLIIDKPSGMTSRAALDRAAAWFPPDTRIGHAGTLDPLASGVLVLCIGKARRLVEYVQDLPKTYWARVLLGARSDTDDADGVCVRESDPPMPEWPDIHQALSDFVGQIQQVPPKFSAARHCGKRAYKLARKHRDFELAPRMVQIHQITIEAYEYPYLDLLIECGKGTYIRSMARDLGERLGCGGLISALRRTRIGGFDETNALQLDADAASAHATLLPLGQAVAHLPRLSLSETLLTRLSRGQRLAQTDIPDLPTNTACDMAAFDAAGQLGVIVRYEPELARISPVKVMLDAPSHPPDQPC
jgi:tRNA pseudouridine55 synthase